jgi:elongation factor Ts
MELDGYCYIESENIAVYNHMAKNGLCAMLSLSKAVEDPTVGKNIAMQIASASPIAIDETGVPQEVKDQEVAVAIEKTKAEQIQKAVEAALKKAGINPNHVDSDDHINSNITKGYITEEQGAQAREIIATVGEEARKNLNDKKIEMIAQGRLNKYYKEVCLLNQAYIDDNKVTVAQYLQNADKELTVTDFKRYTLRAE